MVLRSDVIPEEHVDKILREFGCDTEEYGILHEKIVSGGVLINERIMTPPPEYPYSGMYTELELPEKFCRKDVAFLIRDEADPEKATDLCRVFFNMAGGTVEYMSKDIVLDGQGLYEAGYQPEYYIVPNDFVSLVYHAHIVHEASERLLREGFTQREVDPFIDTLLNGYDPSPLSCETVDDFYRYTTFLSQGVDLYVVRTLKNFYRIDRETVAELMMSGNGSVMEESALLRVLINIGDGKTTPGGITVEKANRLLRESVLDILFPEENEGSKTDGRRRSKPRRA